MSGLRHLRRSISRHMLTNIERSKSGARSLELLHKAVTAWAHEQAEQGAVLQTITENLARLADLHNGLVAELQRRGHLGNDEGLVLTPAGLALPKGVKAEDVKSILGKVGR